MFTIWFVHFPIYLYKNYEIDHEQAQTFEDIIISMITSMIFIRKSQKVCAKNIQKEIDLLESLGFIINYKKNQLIPKQRCTYWFVINSVYYSLELTERKKHQI